MRKAGLEPARPCSHKNLNLACLPIPTLPRTNDNIPKIKQLVNHHLYSAQAIKEPVSENFVSCTVFCLRKAWARAEGVGSGITLRVMLRPVDVRIALTERHSAVPRDRTPGPTDPFRTQKILSKPVFMRVSALLKYTTRYKKQLQVRILRNLKLKQDF